jgi:flavin reductase (DIM6/NTAB) family NADH-FMN oxidoreductase RutF
MEVVLMKEYWKGGNMLYPLPAVMVSCGRKGEKPNIITIAWTGTICTNPPMLYISVRPERHSYNIIKDTGEFVVNLVTKDLTFACDYCGVKSGANVDKFKEMKLTPIASKHVSCPSIEESPLSLECKVKEIIKLGSHDMFIANIVGVAVDSKYMDSTGKFNLNDSNLITYSHGQYFTFGEWQGKFGYSIKKKK